MKRPNGVVSLLIAGATAGFLATFTLAVESQGGPTEAPAGFDSAPVPGFFPGNANQEQAAFDDALAEFVEQEGVDEGLGPVYNAQSCGECHQNPVTGGISQVSELRAGHNDFFGNFVDAPGGSLINDRSIHADFQERVPGAENVRTLRMSLNTLGDGFVEAIDSDTLIAIASAQSGQSGGQIAGQVITVPVLESSSPGNIRRRVGRFGWKNQHASLLSFSSDAYLNEMGITNRFNLVENTSLGNSVASIDPVGDDTKCAANPTVTCGEDTTDDISEFAAFMRATKVPPRDTVLAATADARAGANTFNAIGCNICHTPTIVTAPAGTVINAGAFTVPDALGNKIIHPFSDFLLHDIGTGDGIVQNGGQPTANKLRTRPLWGVRTNARHMHDGQSLTFSESILRHAGEATFVTNRYRALTSQQQNQLITFLRSL
jgi:CxxC motif-containing protein (DUF1111 family)